MNLSSQIKVALGSGYGTDYVNLNFTINGTVVTVEGTTSNPAALKKYVETIEMVPGVTSVKNEATVVEGS